MGQSKRYRDAFFGQTFCSTDRILWLHSGHRHQVRMEGMEKAIEWSFPRIFQVRADVWKESVDLEREDVVPE